MTDNDRPLRLVPMTDAAGAPYIVLLAENGEPLLSGESYSSEQARDDTMTLIANSPIVVVEADGEGSVDEPEFKDPAEHFEED